MSDTCPGDYVDWGIDPAPRLPDPMYRPQGPEALDRLFTAHAKRMEEWSGYAVNKGLENAARQARTQAVIAGRRRARMLQR